MINTTVSVASLLSEVYQSTTSDLNASLARISSGKRVLSAGDDFNAYFKASTNNTYISQYTAFSQEIQKAKGYADAGVATGNKVLADLGKLLDIRNQVNAGLDANQNAALNAQFVAIADSMNKTITGTYIGAKQIYTNGATLYNANATIATQAMGINVGVATGAANASITGIGQTVDSIQTQINAAQNYVAGMQSCQDLCTKQISLVNTIINSYKATNSILVDVNDAEEQLAVTNKQVRLQATASMMAQANSSAAAIARLFS